MGAQRAQDENAKKQMTEKLNDVIPDKKLQDLLKGITHILVNIINALIIFILGTYLN